MFSVPQLSSLPPLHQPRGGVRGGGGGAAALCHRGEGQQPVCAGLLPQARGQPRPLEPQHGPHQHRGPRLGPRPGL